MSNSVSGQDSGEDGQQALVSLLAEALAELEQGGTAAVERLLAAHPAFAPSLRRHLERLRRVGLVVDPGLASPDRAQ